MRDFLLRLLMFVLFMVALTCEGQNYTQLMYVRKVAEDTSYCLRQYVTFEMFRDSVCIDIDYPRWFRRVPGRYDLFVNNIDEEYEIKTIRSHEGYLIYITNLRRRFPSFVMSTGKIC